MPDKNNYNLPKRLTQGKTNRSQEAKPPESFGRGGNIDPKAAWANVQWTPKKLGLVVCFLSIPYLLIVIGTLKSGNTLVAGIMIGLVVLICSLFLLLRWIEKADF